MKVAQTISKSKSETKLIKVSKNKLVVFKTKSICVVGIRCNYEADERLSLRERENCRARACVYCSLSFYHHTLTLHSAHTYVWK